MGEWVRLAVREGWGERANAPAFSGTFHALPLSRWRRRYRQYAGRFLLTPFGMTGEESGYSTTWRWSRGEGVPCASPRGEMEQTIEERLQLHQFSAANAHVLTSYSPGPPRR